MAPAPDRVALGAFVGAVVVGGSNFVGVRISNRELDPLWGAGLRFGLAAAVFGVLCAALRLPLPRGRTLGLLVVYGLLGFAVAYGCLYWALQDVPAGIGAVVMAVGPLLVLLLAVAHGIERFRRRALAGAVVALVGSVVIFFQPSEIAFEWPSLVLLAIAALAASEAVVVSKRVGRQHPVVMNFVAMTAGALALLIASVVAGERLALPKEDETQLALLYLVFATVALFVCVLVVVQRWTASSTAYIFVLMHDRRRRPWLARRRRADHRDNLAGRRDRRRRGLPGGACARRVAGVVDDEGRLVLVARSRTGARYTAARQRVGDLRSDLYGDGAVV